MQSIAFSFYLRLVEGENNAIRRRAAVEFSMHAYLYMGLFFASSALSTVVYKMLLTEGLNAYQIFTYTALMGLPITWMICHKSWRRHLRAVKSDPLLYLIVGLTGFTLYELGFAFALEALPVSQTIILYYVEPIFLYLLSMVFLGKAHVTFKPQVILTLLICFLGVLLVVGDHDMLKIAMRRHGYGWIAIVVAASVFYAIMNKKHDIDEYGYILSSQCMAALIGVVIVTARGWWFVPTFHQALWLIIAATAYNFFNQYFYLKALKVMNVGRLATLSYFSPVVTCFLGVVWLNEKLSLAAVAGLALIICANLWTAVLSRHATRQKEQILVLQP